MSFEHRMPCTGKLPFIALRTRTPHRRTFGAVKHPELQGAVVRHQTGVSAEGINLPDDLSFGDSADGRVAGHLGKARQIHRNQQNGRTHIGRCHRRFTAGMAATNHNDVVPFLHQESSKDWRSCR